MFILNSVVASFLLIAQVMAQLEVQVFQDGDTTCGKAPVKFTRVASFGQCTKVACFATSQGAGLGATTSQRTVCPGTMDADAPGNGSKYAVQTSYTGNTQCATDKTGGPAQLEGLLADGSCHLVGNSYFYAQCSTGAKVQSWSCPTSDCSQGCVLVYDGMDGKCSNGIKFDCMSKKSDVSVESSGSVAVKATAVLALVSGLAALL